MKFVSKIIHKDENRKCLVPTLHTDI